MEDQGGGGAWTEREKLLLFALVCDLWFGPLSRFNLNNFVNVQAQYKMICSELSCRGSRFAGILGSWAGVWFLLGTLSILRRWHSLGASWRVDVGAMHGSRDGCHAVVASSSLHVLLVLLIKVLVTSVPPHLLVAVVDLVLDVRSVVVGLLLVVLVVRAVPPLVMRPATRVHEEVPNGGGLQPELSGNGDLHLLRRPFCLLNKGWGEAHGLLTRSTEIKL